MAEKRTTANKYHNLRNHKCDTLKIITDQNVYLAQNIDENNNEVVKKYHKFTEQQIYIPSIAPKNEKPENNDNSKIS